MSILKPFHSKNSVDEVSTGTVVAAEGWWHTGKPQHCGVWVKAPEMSDHYINFAFQSLHRWLILPGIFTVCLASIPLPAKRPYIFFSFLTHEISFFVVVYGMGGLSLFFFLPSQEQKLLPATSTDLLSRTSPALQGRGNYGMQRTWILSGFHVPAISPALIRASAVLHHLHQHKPCCHTPALFTIIQRSRSPRDLVLLRLHLFSHCSPCLGISCPGGPSLWHVLTVLLTELSTHTAQQPCRKLVHHCSVQSCRQQSCPCCET